ncbi:MAG: hypothetical protein ACI9YM_000984 [Brevundimonas sp.]|jgi:hypothetical protein|uniref:hypothetical protein n=1 Tax=Brevundimonas sp. TaxID=1871086 RepID=UPI0024889612|nr:hypothetical protein [Brevundimonas sp.]MDI1279950.1 hypothetical protein [Brevundimonas sp.]
MSAFEFFFSFYGLLLGLSVAELVAGFARVLHRRKAVRFGWLTPLLAVFVAVDIVTFWNQTWVIFRFAPFNMALLVVGLAVAAVFYVAASVTFPGHDTRDASTDLDDHFWAHRRTVFICVLIANLIIVAVFFANAALSGQMTKSMLSPVFWGGLVLFIGGTSIGAFARSRKIVIAALIVLVAYHGFNVARSAVSLIESGGWSFRAPDATPEAQG